MIKFYCSLVSGNNKNEIEISKLLIDNLLNFLLWRVKKPDQEIIRLKYAICNLIIEILKKPDNGDTILILNQNGLELKTIFEYTINFIKLSLIDILDNSNMELSHIIMYKKKKRNTASNYVGNINSLGNIVGNLADLQFKDNVTSTFKDFDSKYMMSARSMSDQSKNSLNIRTIPSLKFKRKQIGNILKNYTHNTKTNI